MTAPDDEPRWLDTERLVAWRRFVAVVELVPGVLDSQLRRDAHLTHFEYLSLAMLSEAADSSLRMSELAAETNSTLPRLSHVVSRLESRGLVERATAVRDRRSTNVRLTEAGWEKVVATAPGHAATVREYVIDPLDDDDIADLARIASKMLERLDPDGRMH